MAESSGGGVNGKSFKSSPFFGVSHALDPLATEKNFCSNIIQAANRECLGTKVNVSEFLNFEEQQALQTAFPEYNLSFSGKRFNSHAFSAASRRLELLVLLDRVGYSPNVSFEGYDDLICDIGGDFSVHLLNDRVNIHSCCPVLDIRDSQRHLTRMENLRRVVLNVDERMKLLNRNSLDRITSLLSNDPKTVLSSYCSNKAQNCNRTARYGLCLHSSYDINVRDLGLIMQKKNMVELYGSFIFSDEVLLEESGHIKGVNANFVKKGEFIEFSFVNDSSMVYKHRIKDYLSLVMVSGFEIGADSGSSFFVEMLENRAGVQFFKISRLQYKLGRNELMTRNIWLKSTAGMTKVNFFEIDYDRFAVGDFKSGFKPVSFYVDTAVVDKIMSHAYASTEAKFRPVEIFNFLCSYNGRIFFGSDVCVRYRQVPAYKAMMLANAVYLEVFVKKYDIGKVNQLLMSAIRHDRDLSERNLFGKLTMSRFTPPEVLGTGHSQFRWSRSLFAPLHAILYFFKKSPYNAHKFLTDAVQFIRCDTVLRELRFCSIDSANVVCNEYSFSVPEVCLDPSLVLIDNLTSLLKDSLDPEKRLLTVQDIPLVSISSLGLHGVASGEPNSLMLTKYVVKDDYLLTKVKGDLEKLVVKTEYSVKDFGFLHLSKSGNKILVVTWADISLVNLLLEMGYQVYLYGFDVRLHSLLVNSDNLFLISGKNFFSDIIKMCSVNFFQAALVPRDMERTPDCFVHLCNSSFRCPVYVQLPLESGVSVLSYVLSCVKYSCGGFDSTFVRDFYLLEGFKEVTHKNFLYFSYDIACANSVRPSAPAQSLGSSTDDSLDSSSVSPSLSMSTVSSSSVFSVVPSVSPPSSISSFVSCDSAIPAVPFSTFPVSVDLQSRVKDFCDKLDHSLGTVRKGKMGDRIEWLFSPIPYFYGGKFLQPIGDVSAVISDPVVSDFNACLVVFYSSSCSGLSFHRDDEYEMGSHKVLTLSCGSSCTVSLKDKGTCDTLSVTPSVGYILHNQDTLRHKVDTDGERYALTFRKFFDPGCMTLVRPSTVSEGDYSKLGIECLSDDVFLKRRRELDPTSLFSGAVCRSAFKLLEMMHLFPPTGTVLDLCAAPGGFSQVLKHFKYNTKALLKPGSSLSVEVDEVFFFDLSTVDTKTISAAIGPVDFVVADGAVSDAMSLTDNLDSQLSLISAELDLIRALDVNFFVLKVPMLAETIDLLSRKGLDRIKLVRPRATRGISLEAYIIYSKDFFPVDLKTLLTGFNNLRFLEGTFFKSFGSPPPMEDLLGVYSVMFEYSKGISLIPSLPGLVINKNKILDNNGAGNCLFHSLLGTDSVDDAKKLRQIIRSNRPNSMADPSYSSSDVDEECSGDNWAGTSTILAYGFLFNTSVKVFDRHSGECLISYYPDCVPFMEISLLYTKYAHYTRYNLCELKENGRLGVNRLLPVSVDRILQLLKGLFFKSENSGIFDLFRNTKTTDELQLYNKDQLTSNILYNSFLHLCLNHDCQCVNGVLELLNECRAAGSVNNLFVLFPLEYSVKRLEDFLSEHTISCRLLVLPQLVRQGILCLLFSFSENYRSFSLTNSFQLVQRHVGSCVSCNSENSFSSPYYNHLTNTYYFCSEDKEKVSFVDDMTGALKILQLFVVTSTTSPQDRFRLVETSDCVLVPIHVSSVGVISPKCLTKLRSAVDAYFTSNGTVSCIGLLNCGLSDIRELLLMLTPFTSRILIKSESLKIKDFGVDFKPEFVVTTGDTSYIVNSLIESREYHKAAMTSIINNIKPLHRQYMRLYSDRTIDQIQTITNNNPDYGLIDVGTANYLVRPKTYQGPYQYGFDGSELVSLERYTVGGRGRRNDNPKRLRDWFEPGKGTGYVSVSQETKLVNSVKIYNRLSGYKLRGKYKFTTKLTLVEGVPGCGKTHYIIQNHKFNVATTEEIVLTCSREAAMDLRRRVAREYAVNEDDRILSLRYRTVDSFLMHYNDRDYKIRKIWLDEGLLKHFGELLWCAVISNCEEMVIIGDRAQIPFYNRIGGIKLEYHLINLSDSTLSTSFLNTTRRCPVDVAVVLDRLQVYSTKVFSSSSITRSLHCRTISNVSELTEFRDYQVLVFTQGEKYELSKVFGRVFTINEFQGNQSSKVLLIRTNPKNIGVYSSINHILVGISRHTDVFMYATVVMDKCFELLKTPILEGEIIACKSSKLLGGGLLMGRTLTRQYPIFNVTPRCAVSLDMLKQDTVIRDFVQDNLGHGVVPMRLHLDEISVVIPSLPEPSHYTVTNPVVTMQFYYDEFFPGHSCAWRDYDDLIFNEDELNFSTRESLRLTEYCTNRKGIYDCLSPALRTSCPTPVSSSLKQVLKAFYDRNGNVPMLSGIVDDYAMADKCFSMFVDAFVGDRELFEIFKEEKISVNVDSIEDWLGTQPLSVRSQAFDQEFSNIFERELNVYSMILKKLPKPKLDVSALGKYPSPQTIAHLTKDVNAVLCPIFREIKKRLLSVLRRNVILFSDASIENLEELLTVRFPASRLSLFPHLLELDMSKYDKSQGRLALLLELKILRALGFPPDLLSTWVYMHVYTRVIDRINKVAAKILFQRKSGDPWTFGGNTVHLMATLIQVLCLFDHRMLEKVRNEKVLMLFSGDDSLIFSQEPLDAIGLTQELANTFNLEGKLLSHSSPYFCSKFLLMTPAGRWVIIPDVVKLLIKLGRRDMVNFQHVDEYRISCLDVARSLGISALYPIYDAAVLDRYKCGLTTLGYLYSAMFTAFSDQEAFRELYYIRDNAVISERVYREIYDI